MSYKCSYTCRNVCLLIKAGIPDNHLELVLEPEAASIYCLLMHLDDKDMHRTNIFTRKHWNKYMVLDLGGKFYISVASTKYRYHELREVNV